MYGALRKRNARRFMQALNRADEEAILDLIADDFSFIDSMSRAVEGRDRFADYLRTFFAMDVGLRTELQSLCVAHDQVLVSGQQQAQDSRFDAKMQWRFAFSGLKIVELQSYRGAGAPSMLRIIANRMERQMPLARPA